MPRDDDDCDRNCSLEYLSHFKAEVCCCCTEDYGQDKAGGDRIWRYFRVVAGRMHHGPVLFVGAEFGERVFRKIDGIDICGRHIRGAARYVFFAAFVAGCFHNM